jgi:hypothetical protein
MHPVRTQAAHTEITPQRDSATTDHSMPPHSTAHSRPPIDVPSIPRSSATMSPNFGRPAGSCAQHLRPTRTPRHGRLSRAAAPRLESGAGWAAHRWISGFIAPALLICDDGRCCCDTFMGTAPNGPQPGPARSAHDSSTAAGQLSTGRWWTASRCSRHSGELCPTCPRQVPVHQLDQTHRVGVDVHRLVVRACQQNLGRLCRWPRRLRDDGPAMQ